MIPEIDETIYFLKTRLLQAETLLEQMLAGGGDNTEFIKKEIRDSYDAVSNLQKILKTQDESNS